MLPEAGVDRLERVREDRAPLYVDDAPAGANATPGAELHLRQFPPRRRQLAARGRRAVEEVELHW